MKVNVSAGIDLVGQLYLEKFIDKVSEKEVIEIIGGYKPIKIYRYKLKNGSYANEYLQFISESVHGQIIHFIGLKIGKRDFQWKTKKILNTLDNKF